MGERLCFCLRPVSVCWFCFSVICLCFVSLLFSVAKDTVIFGSTVFLSVCVTRLSAEFVFLLTSVCELFLYCFLLLRDLLS